jgi:hypothetical protein
MKFSFDRVFSLASWALAHFWLAGWLIGELAVLLHHFIGCRANGTDQVIC